MDSEHVSVTCGLIITQDGFIRETADIVAFRGESFKSPEWSIEISFEAMSLRNTKAAASSNPSLIIGCTSGCVRNCLEKRAVPKIPSSLQPMMGTLRLTQIPP
jgi:hypothetical protein